MRSNFHTFFYKQIGLEYHDFEVTICSKHVVFSSCILLLKIFWPTVRKNCFSDREKLLKFEAEGREFEKKLRSVHCVPGGQTWARKLSELLVWIFMLS